MVMAYYLHRWHDEAHWLALALLWSGTSLEQALVILLKREVREAQGEGEGRERVPSIHSSIHPRGIPPSRGWMALCMTV